MAERSISIRLSLEDRDNIRRRLEELGRAGDESAARLAAAFNKVPPAAAGAGSAVRGAGDAIRNVGYQLNDVIVQLQGGQSPFLVLSQQGAQLAQMLPGLAGVIGGLAIPLGAVAAQWLVFGGNVKSAEEKIKDVEGAIGKLNAVLLTDQQKKYAEQTRQLNEAFADADRQIAELEPELQKLKRAYDSIAGSVDGLRRAGVRPTMEQTSLLARAREEYRSLDVRLDALQRKREALNDPEQLFPEQRRREQEDAALMFIKNINDQAAAEIKRRQAIEDVIPAQQRELDIIGLKTQAERELAQARQKAQDEVVRAAGYDPLRVGLNDLSADVVDQARQAAVLAEQRLRTEKQNTLELQAQRQSLAEASAIAAQIDKDRHEAFQRSRQLEDERFKVVGESERQVELLQRQAQAAQQSEIEFDSLTGAYRLNARELEVLTRQSELMRQSHTLGADEARARAEAEVDAAEALRRVQDQQRLLVDDLNRSRELMLEPFKNLASGVQSAFAETFESIIAGSEDTFAAVKRLAIRFTSELLAASVMQGISGLLFAGAPAVLAGGGIGAGSGIGGSGIGGVLPALPGTPGYVAGAAAGGLGGVLSPGNVLGLGSLLTSGFPILSQAQAAVLLNGLGLGGSATLSSMLAGGVNASPFGFIGTLGAGFLGPAIGVNTGGLGGTLGGAAGSFIGGAALAPFGLGPVGAIAGGFLGSLGGGFVEDLFGGGGMSEEEYWANVNYYNQQAQLLKAQAQGAVPYNAYLGRGRRAAAGGPLSTQVGQALAAAAAEFEQMRAQAEQLQFAIGPLEDAFASLTQRIKDDFVRGIDDARLAIEDPGGAAKRALDAEAKVLRADAADAGVGSTGVEALIAAQAKKARDDLDSGLAVALAQFTGDASASFDALLRQQAERKRQVETLGADMVRAEQLSASERVAYFRQLTDAQREAMKAQLTAVQQLELATAELLNKAATTATDGARSLAQLAEATRSFGESVDALNRSLTTSALSPYSTATKYQLARAQYEQTLAAAEGGDVEAMGRYAADRQAFLELSRAMFGGSDQYQIDFARTLAEGEAIVAGAPGRADSIEATGKDYSKLAERIVGAMTDAMVRRAEAEPLLGEGGALRAELVDLVGPGSEAVSALDELIARLQQMADVTKVGAIAGVASAASSAQANFDQLQNWLRYAQVNVGDANALQHALTQATAVRQGLAGNVGAAAGLLPDTWDDAGAAANYAAAQGLYGQQNGLVEQIAALLEQRRAADAAAAAEAARRAAEQAQQAAAASFITPGPGWGPEGSVGRGADYPLPAWRYTSPLDFVLSAFGGDQNTAGAAAAGGAAAVDKSALNASIDGTLSSQELKDIGLGVVGLAAVQANQQVAGIAVGNLSDPAAWSEYAKGLVNAMPAHVDKVINDLKEKATQSLMSQPVPNIQAITNVKNTLEFMRERIKSELNAAANAVGAAAGGSGDQGGIGNPAAPSTNLGIQVQDINPNSATFGQVTDYNPNTSPGVSYGGGNNSSGPGFSDSPSPSDMAAGGWVFGAGPKGVDSEWRRLAPGEFVVPWPQSERHADTLQRIRAGAPPVGSNDNRGLLEELRLLRRSHELLLAEVQVLRRERQRDAAAAEDQRTRQIQVTENIGGKRLVGQRR